MSLRFQRADNTSSQSLATGSLSYTTSISRKFKLVEVNVHASQAITETITIKRDSANGANYDVILASRDLVSEQDFVFRPQGECLFQDGDEVNVQCTNANGTGIVYIVVKTQELP